MNISIQIFTSTSRNNISSRNLFFYFDLQTRQPNSNCRRRGEKSWQLVWKFDSFARAAYCDPKLVILYIVWLFIRNYSNGTLWSNWKMGWINGNYTSRQQHLSNEWNKLRDLFILPKCIPLRGKPFLLCLLFIQFVYKKVYVPWFNLTKKYLISQKLKVIPRDS